MVRISAVCWHLVASDRCGRPFAQAGYLQHVAMTCDQNNHACVQRGMPRQLEEGGLRRLRMAQGWAGVSGVDLDEHRCIWRRRRARISCLQVLRRSLDGRFAVGGHCAKLSCHSATPILIRCCSDPPLRNRATSASIIPLVLQPSHSMCLPAGLLSGPQRRPRGLRF